MNTQSNKPQSKNYHGLWFIIFFGILFQGFKALLEHYLQRDRLSFGHFFLIGVPSALISVIVERFAKHKSRTFKILIVIVLLTVVVILNIGLRSFHNL